MMRDASPPSASSTTHVYASPRARKVPSTRDVSPANVTAAGRDVPSLVAELRTRGDDMTTPSSHNTCVGKQAARGVHRLHNKHSGWILNSRERVHNGGEVVNLSWCGHCVSSRRKAGPRRLCGHSTHTHTHTQTQGALLSLRLCWQCEQRNHGS